MNEREALGWLDAFQELFSDVVIDDDALEYDSARLMAMKGLSPWPTVPKKARAKSSGALAAPTNELAEAARACWEHADDALWDRRCDVNEWLERVDMAKWRQGQLERP